MFFTGVNYYDGQGFMVRKKLGVDSALKLDGASVCVQQGTTTELNLADYFRAHNMKFEAVVFATDDETVKAYDSGRCDAYTTDASGLYAERLKLTVPDDNVVLPEIISKEPLGPVGAQGRHAMVRDRAMDALRADHRGGARRDAGQRRREAEIRQPGNPPAARRRRRFRQGPRADQRLGLPDHQGGGQLRRNRSSATSAMGSPIKIARGLNALWTKGGLQYAPPIR